MVDLCCKYTWGMQGCGVLTQFDEAARNRGTLAFFFWVGPFLRTPHQHVAVDTDAHQCSLIEQFRSDLA